MTDFWIGILELSAGMSLLIGLVLLLLQLVGKHLTAKCRYILWMLLLLRLAIPWSSGVLPSLMEIPIIPEQTEQIPETDFMAVGETILLPETDDYAPPVTENPPQIPQPSVETVFPATETQRMVYNTDTVVKITSVVYGTGAVLFFLWQLVMYILYTGRILKNARPVDTETRVMLKTVCRKKGLTKVPSLLTANGIHSPAAFGLFRQYIVLPDIAFSENGLVSTLAHEVTHLKRRDLWVKLFSLAACSLHWFNPLVHVAAFRCEMEMELSCDEAVLTGCSDESRAAYGEVMLDIIRRCRGRHGSLTTHFNPRKNAVTMRFKNILYGSGKGRGYVLIGMCVVLCILAGTIVACQSDGETDFPMSEETDDTVESSEEMVNSVIQNAQANLFNTPKLPGITDIEDYKTLGDGFYPFFYEYTKAFLTGDTATMETIGRYETGTLADYRNLAVGDYRIYYDDSYQKFLLEAEILTGIEGIEAGTRRFYYEEYPGTGLMLVPEEAKPVSEAGTRLSRLLNMTMEYELSAMLENTFTTEYIISCLAEKTGQNAFDAAEIVQYAKTVFVAEHFVPSESCLYNGKYSIPGHGGNHILHEITGIEEQQGDGGNTVTTVTVRFFADKGKTVYSHLITYEMEKSGEDWIFRGQSYVEERELKPYRYAT